MFEPIRPQTMGRLRGLAVPLALFAAWGVTAHYGAGPRHILVPLERIATLPFTDPAGRTIWLNMIYSIVRLSVGFSIGAGLGLTLGLAMGMSRLAHRSMSPTFSALRAITLFAWIPLLTAWFGNGEPARIVYVALSAFFPIVLNTQKGLATIAPELLEVAQVLHLSRRRRISHVLLPGALPSILVGLQIGLISAWLGTVGAEYAIGAGPGIGRFLAEGREQFRMDVVLLGVVMLAFIGYGLNWLCKSSFAPVLRRQGRLP